MKQLPLKREFLAYKIEEKKGLESGALRHWATKKPFVVVVVCGNAFKATA